MPHLFEHKKSVFNINDSHSNTFVYCVLYNFESNCSSSSLFCTFLPDYLLEFVCVFELFVLFFSFWHLIGMYFWNVFKLLELWFYINMTMQWRYLVSNVYICFIYISSSHNRLKKILRIDYIRPSQYASKLWKMGVKIFKWTNMQNVLWIHWTDCLGV